MTFNEKKQCLNKYRLCRIKIIRLKEQCKVLESICEKTTPRLTNSAGGGQNLKDDCYVKLMELTDKLEYEKLNCIGLMERVEMAIDSIPDETNREIFKMRYTGCMSWEEIAEVIGFSEVSSAHKRHRKVLMGHCFPLLTCATI